MTPGTSNAAAEVKTTPTGWAALVLAWTLVGVPLAWGVYMTVLNALKLFSP